MSAAWLIIATALASTDTPGGLPAQTLAQHEPIAGIAAVLTEPLLSEVSGAAGSRRDPSVLWLINDSGNGARLFALGVDGLLRAEWPLDGARNHDWEDLAAYEHDDGPHLAIADVGDNGGVRASVRVLLLREPDLSQAPQPLTVQRELELRYPDEPHDVESLAIDPQRPIGYLVTKRTKPPRLYRFRLDADSPQVVELVADLEQMPRLTDEEVRSEQGFNRYRHQPTAMDLSCSGDQLWVLTYGSIQRYHRPRDGDWDGSLREQTPQALALMPLPQAESLAFDRDCRFVYVLSELSPVPIVRYRLR